ncbi:MAG TPA: DUF4397 domain-containing protein [Gemmatimonadaceae bacterium]|nr:DUF4397 domain-containing protein [Gemmatimonadaceae bacterium]
MRLSRFVIIALGAAAFTACSNTDEITTPGTPTLGTVRFINAVADTGAVDIRMIDQVEWSAFANNLPFRSGTEYFPTEAKSRRIRVFPTSKLITVTSQILLDEEVNVAANSRVTLLLTGSARNKTLHFVTITDETGQPPAGQIGVRMVNASSGAVTGYLVNSFAAADPLPGTATFANVGALGVSPYVNKAAGAAAVRVADVGGATANASLAGPTAPAGPAGSFPAAGVTQAGTNFSVYYFPRGVAGSPNNGLTTPAVVWFVDRNPCDAPAITGCGT